MIVRATILAPQNNGTVRFIRDGIIVGDAHGRIEWIGEFSQFPGRERADIQRCGIICPPFFDDHIHIPQHPIRGHFMDGVDANSPNGRLLAGLNRNVFPAEARCSDRDYTEQCVRDFLADTLAKGVIGGAAYMTVHAAAARIALEMLPASWSVGLVMMNQKCPEYLRSDEAHFERDAESLARDFGQRYIVTDRFAVACDSSLRRRGADIARRFKLRMQTHLNEQLKEKELVENWLYPGISYTDVYESDGLLEHQPIMAHCVHMHGSELKLLERRRAVIAHCPTSNTLLGSGIMPLDDVLDHGIDYAICTDVGASPTTSLLAEMAQFLKVHAGRSKRATPSEALYRTTLAASRIMGAEQRSGLLEVGRPMSFVEIDSTKTKFESADKAISEGLLELSQPDLRAAFDMLATGKMDAGPELDQLAADVESTARALERKVRRVVIDGETIYDRDNAIPSPSGRGLG